MENELYKLSFFVNASHMVNINGKLSSKHPHTFEIVCYIKSKGFVAFEEMENNINQILNQLNNHYLNELDAFKEKNPTLENISRLLFKVIGINLESIRCNLVRIEVSESPVRSFVIDNQK
ncbi:MAG: 6-carboxytetrahydropterin synthase [Candidatus Limosilactobacillus merdavium]|uniref:6-carboxy-5,6,7,8-tetrahydropterin synthase n=1 Tax=Candidatus Limosilactobacillus merdavium TaxID=2838651 RepID=A0A9E2KW21_9LACO|nr:6-carboxytetrahydropterin synthase [Candidatus Limosilactobacillus merdavium]